MAKNTVTVRKLSEVPRSVVNHAGRGDSRPVVTKLEQSLYDMPMDKLTEKTSQKMAEDALEAGTSAMAVALDVWLKKHPEYAAIDRRNDKTAGKNSAAIVANPNPPESVWDGWRKWESGIPSGQRMRYSPLQMGRQVP